MNRFLKLFFGIPAMAVLLVIFATAIGYATFVESKYGTIAAKATIYNTLWFEIIIVLLNLNLIVNIFRYKIYETSKLPIFLFHISFIMIFVGAAFTRYSSVDGMMRIREGQSSNYFSSSSSFVKTKIKGQETEDILYSKTFLSPLTQRNFKETIDFRGDKIKLRSKSYYPSSETLLMPSENGRAIAKILISYMHQSKEIIISEGDIYKIDNLVVSFTDYSEADINLKFEEGKLKVKSLNKGIVKSMRDTGIVEISASEYSFFESRQLYTFGDIMVALIDFSSNAELVFKTSNSEKYQNNNIVELNYIYKGLEKSFFISESTPFSPINYIIKDDDLEIEFYYGARLYQIPFSVYLEDFIIERYPGSSSPSSFISNVELIDENKNSIMHYSIFMNHILNYKGFRFFQSSYDTDERGTILSVNFDFLGMRITYTGYFFMILGMVLALFWKGSQFRNLLKKLNTQNIKNIIILIALAGFSLNGYSQQNEKFYPKKNAAESFGNIWVQEKEGRIKPLHSYNIDILRKIYGKASYNGLSADQVIMGIMMHPEHWQSEKIIKVSNKNISERLGLEGKYASFNDFFEEEFHYKLKTLLEQSHKKFPTQRSKFDTDIISIDERINVFSMVQLQTLLRVFPDPNDTHNPWLTRISQFNSLNSQDSLFVKSSISLYLNFLKKENGNEADFVLKGIKDFQKKHAKDVLPSDTRLTFEILYDNLGIFQKLAIVYLLLGIISLFVIFSHRLSKKKKSGTGILILKTLLWISLIIHAIGIGIRWYISGYAPFSNGYEAMIFISWSGIFAGMLLSRKSLLLIPVVSLFAAAPLLVAYLTMMNPNITNLVPVLKSYWLTIHVATITSSYGVLGSVFFGSFLAIVLSLFKNKTNQSKLNEIIDELTTLNKLSTILGLYLLTIGCFLGGVWANESWGTYWSWDPKETWCLVSILIYSLTAHLNYIPGLKTNYAFNVAAFWSYSTILMTYFGVNYFLGGMHSYAKGDSVQIHFGYYLTIAILLIISLLSIKNEKKMKKLNSK